MFFPQDSFEELAGWGFGEGIKEFYRGRLLIAGEVRAAALDDFFGGGGVAFPQHDAGLHSFPVHGMRDADHSTFLYGRVPVDDLLNAGAEDVFASGDDHVFLAIHHVHVAVGVPSGDVPGVAPASAQGLSGEFGHVPVTAHDVSAAHNHLAGSFPVPRDLLVVLVHDPDITKKGLAAAGTKQPGILVQPADVIFRTQPGRHNADFGLSHVLQESYARKHLHGTFEGGGGEGAAAVGDEAECAGVEGMEVGYVHDVVHHRGDGEKTRDAVFLDDLQHAARLKIENDDLGAMEHVSVRQQHCDVEHLAHDDVDVVGGDVLGNRHVHHRGVGVLMGDHGALRHARGATGVADEVEIVIAYGVDGFGLGIRTR